MLKKLLIGFGVVIGLFVVAAILVPVFVDANKFRPQIEKAVEDNMNADLDLGKLKLSLWGGLSIHVEHMVLSQKGSKSPIVSLKDFKLEIPILSVFTGRPSVTIDVKNPEITIVKEKDGKLNVMKLSKTSPEAAVQGQAQAEAGKSGGIPTLPFELSFDIERGRFIYADQIRETKTEITGIDFELHKFGFNKPFTFEFDSDLDSKEMKGLVLKGPAELKGTLGVYMNGAGLERFDLDAQANLSGLVIKYGTMLNKAEKVALKADIKLSTTTKDLKIDKGHFEVGDAAVDVKGTVSNFDAPALDLFVESTKFDFGKWQQVVGPLRDFDMQGTAGFNIQMKGALAELSINGKAQAQNIRLKAPGIVPKITDLNAHLEFTKDTARLSGASLKMGASDLAFEGTVKNFSAPVVAFNIRSNLLDVDSLLPQKTPEQVKAEKDSAQKAQGGDPNADPTAGPIAAMKKNPMMRALDFTGNAQFKKIVVHKAPLTNFVADITFKDLTMSLKRASAAAFGGSGNFTSIIDFKGVDPSYLASGELSGIDVNEAVASQMPSIKDTILGKMFAKFSVSGDGVTKPKVSKTLKGSGNFRVDNGSWSSLKVLQQLSEKAPAQVKDKLGAINVSDKFRQLKADFTIANAQLNIQNMIADMEANNTAITGQGAINFDLGLAMNLTVLTPSNIDGAEKAGDGRSKIPVELGCKLTAPCPNFNSFIQTFARNRVKQEGGKAIKKELEKIDNPQVKELLKKLPF